MTRLSDPDWAAMLERAAAGDTILLDGRPLPPMPDAQMQINTVGQSGPAAIREAWDFAARCLDRFRSTAAFADPARTLMDFGTGWGRVARCFLRDFAAKRMIGVDVDADYIALCRAQFEGPRFLHCAPLPPLALPSESIDFIVGYSVFSHLSEATCRAWIAEFGRLLKPGGMVAVTTRGRWFFDFAANLAPTDPYSRALSTMFADFAAARARYDRGEIVHSNADGISGGGPRHADFYGETFIPEGYAREVLGQLLTFREFIETGSHPILLFEKTRQ